MNAANFHLLGIRLTCWVSGWRVGTEIFFLGGAGEIPCGISKIKLRSWAVVTVPGAWIWTLQNDLQPLCTFLPRPGAIRVAWSPMSGACVQTTPLGLGAWSLACWEIFAEKAHVTDVRIWRHCAECSVVCNVLQHGWFGQCSSIVLGFVLNRKISLIKLFHTLKNKPFSSDIVREEKNDYKSQTQVARIR